MKVEDHIQKIKRFDGIKDFCRGHRCCEGDRGKEDRQGGPHGGAEEIPKGSPINNLSKLTFFERVYIS
jgi:hypothetical protein